MIINGNNGCLINIGHKCVTPEYILFTFFLISDTILMCNNLKFNAHSFLWYEFLNRFNSRFSRFSLWFKGRKISQAKNTTFKVWAHKAKKKHKATKRQPIQINTSSRKYSQISNACICIQWIIYDKMLVLMKSINVKYGAVEMFKFVLYAFLFENFQINY